MNQDSTDFYKDIYLIDTAAILAGLPLNHDHALLMTVSNVSDEFKPGGRTYRMFQYLIEKGLRICDPTQKARAFVLKTAKEYGEHHRLSDTDTALLALAVDIKNDKKKHPVIVTDDYSIQNIADVLSIDYQGILERGITKRFKWIRRCRGCKKIINEDVPHCPICGSEFSYVRSKTSSLKKKRDQ